MAAEVCLHPPVKASGFKRKEEPMIPSILLSSSSYAHCPWALICVRLDQTHPHSPAWSHERRLVTPWRVTDKRDGGWMGVGDGLGCGVCCTALCAAAIDGVLVRKSAVWRRCKGECCDHRAKGREERGTPEEDRMRKKAVSIAA